MQVAELIVLTNAPNRYTYAIPQGLSLVAGDFVDVLFAKRAQVGCVMRIYDANEDDFPYRLSVIQSRHEKRLPVPLFLLQMIEWFSKHYCVTEYKALQCMVGLKKHRQDEFKPIIPNKSLSSLSKEQEKVFDSMLDSSQLSHLLHGVTGSGKTQIYAHLIQMTIQAGQSAIVLIPEISLTPQFTSFFSDIFSRVAVVHSGLTPKKKEIIRKKTRKIKFSDCSIRRVSQLDYVPGENLNIAKSADKENENVRVVIWMLLCSRVFSVSANCGTLNIAKKSRSMRAKQHFSMENYENRTLGIQRPKQHPAIALCSTVAGASSMAL